MPDNALPSKSQAPDRDRPPKLPGGLAPVALRWECDPASLGFATTAEVRPLSGFFGQERAARASHQDPGFIDVALNKKPDVVRVYLPADANTLLCVTDHVLRTWNRINIIVAGKPPAWQWLSMEEAIAHCRAGIGVWDWASTDEGKEPDVVMACAGDAPTLETLAAVQILRELAPKLKIRVVNVIDLMSLLPKNVHPHGLSNEQFDAIFTTAKPVIFAYHGYPATIHKLTYRRANHPNIHVRGYNEEGTTTTPFDMTVLNGLDRFHLVQNVLKWIPGAEKALAGLNQLMDSKLEEHHGYIRKYGQDMPEIRERRWSAS